MLKWVLFYGRMEEVMNEESFEVMYFATYKDHILALLIWTTQGHLPKATHAQLKKIMLKWEVKTSPHQWHVELGCSDCSDGRKDRVCSKAGWSPTESIIFFMCIPAWVFTEWFVAMAALKSQNIPVLFGRVGIVTRFLCKVPSHLSWMRQCLLNPVVLKNTDAFAFVGSFGAR